MLKPKQLFTIIFVNVCVKRAYPHKTNNNILFCCEKIPESQFSVSSSNLNFHKTVNATERQNDHERAVGMVQTGMTH